MSKDNKLKTNKKEESVNGSGIVTVESRAIKRLSVTCTIHDAHRVKSVVRIRTLKSTVQFTDIQLHASSL